MSTSVPTLGASQRSLPIVVLLHIHCKQLRLRRLRDQQRNEMTEQRQSNRLLRFRLSMSQSNIGSPSPVPTSVPSLAALSSSVPSPDYITIAAPSPVSCPGDSPSAG